MLESRGPLGYVNPVRKNGALTLLFLERIVEAPTLLGVFHTIHTMNGWAF
jgi:hypothetical protein